MIGIMILEVTPNALNDVIITRTNERQPTIEYSIKITSDEVMVEYYASEDLGLLLVPYVSWLRAIVITTGGRKQK